MKAMINLIQPSFAGDQITFGLGLIWLAKFRKEADMGFKMRKTTYVDIDIDRSKLVTLSEAAEIIGMSLPGVIRAIERGVLTEIIDENAGYHNRRLLIRDEVEEFKKTREKD